MISFEMKSRMFRGVDGFASFVCRNFIHGGSSLGSFPCLINKGEHVLGNKKYIYIFYVTHVAVLLHWHWPAQFLALSCFCACDQLEQSWLPCIRADSTHPFLDPPLHPGMDLSPLLIPGCINQNISIVKNRKYTTTLLIVENIWTIIWQFNKGEKKQTETKHSMTYFFHMRTPVSFGILWTEWKALDSSGEIKLAHLLTKAAVGHVRLWGQIHGHL